MLEIAVSVGILVLLLTLVWLVSHRRRQGALATLALRMGLRYSVHDQFDLLDRFAGLYPMQFGHSARIFNVIHGRRDERHIMAFDYCYEVGAGQSRTTRYYSIVVWTLGKSMPALVALAEDDFDAMGRFASFEHLRLEDAAFDKRFHLYTDQVEAIRRFLTKPLRRIMLLCPKANWEFNDNYLAIFIEAESTPLLLARLIHYGNEVSKLGQNA